MSYEGYTEVLCEVGHYAQYDVYDAEKSTLVCRVPGRPHSIVWTREVDLTNGRDPMVPDSCSAHDLGWLLLRLPTSTEAPMRGVPEQTRYVLTPTYYDMAQSSPSTAGAPDAPRCE